MIQSKEFAIIDGKLKSYFGTGGDIIIPNGVIQIGKRAFSSCRDITSVQFPKTLILIEEYAFSGCKSIKSLSIPASVTSIAENAFYYCSGIERITVSKKNTVFYSKHNCIIERNKNSLVLGCKNSLIPHETEKINNYAFAGCSALEKAVIPAEVTSIGDFAFSGCKMLKSLSIPAEVKKIGKGAFEGCSRIEKLSVNRKNTIFYNKNNCVIDRKSNKLILGCKNSVIPGGIKTIGAYSFSGNNELTDITVPDSVQTIGEYAFSECGNLVNIILPDGLKKIEDSAFSSCRSLKEVTLPEKLSVLGNSAFAKCKNLDSVTIPKKTNNIGTNVFLNCDKLTALTIKNSFADGYLTANNIRTEYIKKTESQKTDTSIKKKKKKTAENTNFAFISYAHKDFDTIKPILSTISEKYNIWFDNSIEVGTEWPKTIAEHIAKSSSFIVFMSRNWLNSTNCKREFNFGDMKGIPFVVIFIEDFDITKDPDNYDMCMQMSLYQHIHKTRFSDEDFYKQLYSSEVLKKCRKT